VTETRCRRDRIILVDNLSRATGLNMGTSPVKRPGTHVNIAYRTFSLTITAVPEPEAPGAEPAATATIIGLLVLECPPLPAAPRMSQ
jgi:hypothetical protein